MDPRPKANTEQYTGNVERNAFYLYFILRSVIMGLLGAVLFSVFVWALKLTELSHILVLSIVNFFLVLFISRLSDRQIKSLVDRLLGPLNRHPKARDFILKNF